MNQAVLILIIVLVIGGAGLLWYISPAKSKMIIANDESQFPKVSGFNLDRQEFIFPQDFEGDLNLVVVAFQQEHQALVNTWIPFMQKLEKEYPGLIYYELPTIQEMPAISRTFINEGMRAGIPDKKARERTITLYIDKEIFRSALSIPNEQTIYLMLVEQDGGIIWRAAGAYDDATASGLVEFLEGIPLN